MIKKLLPILMLTLLFTFELHAFTFSSTTGFAIPVGSWANQHSSSPFISIGSVLIRKNFASLGISLDLFSFSGKLNENYHLQIVSPGTCIKFYPLFFANNHILIVKETLSYVIMQRKLHDSFEKGKDFALLSAIGAEFKFGENWFISSCIGDNHYAGGMDMFIFSFGIEFRK
ncbi:MAG: hypothetical protein E3J78_00620 [Candidatus Cloacimonadota bacterium]|nr:MAG: hypothetical protein E3J78_00620 [Candidatus Cloacimonadota bacterium]